MKRQTLARLKLLSVFLLFAAPLAIAYTLYYGMPKRIDGAGTNKGSLVSPVQPLPAMSFEAESETLGSGDVFAEKWTFLQVAPAGCGDACRTSLRETRQVRALLHRRSTRVQRVLVTSADAPRPAFDSHPDLQVFTGGTAALSELFEAQSASAPGTVYLVDPLGNWLLFYPPGQNSEALFQDTKHLLKLSHIG